MKGLFSISISLCLFSFLCFTHFSWGQFSVQKCVMERYTGNWAGYEPDAAAILEDILQTNDKVIPVSIHNGDSMEITDGIFLQSFYCIGYPTATFNRLDQAISRASWASAVSSILVPPSSATVSFDSVWFNSASRQLDIDLRVTFTGTESGNMRFNCIVVEDGVIDFGIGYDQVNYYNTTSGHPYFGAGNPIIGYVHRFVAREYLGGAFGTGGVIPSAVSFGSTYVQHYTYVIPEAYNLDQISLVGMVSKYEGIAVTDRYIINGESFDLNDAYVNDLGVQEPELNKFTLFPNPANEFLSVRFDQPVEAERIDVYTMDGKLVQSEFISQVQNSFMTFSVADLSPGHYMIVCGTTAKKFVKLAE